MRSNLILFVLVLVNQDFIRDEHEDEDDDEGASCRAVAQRAKAAHLTSAIDSAELVAGRLLVSDCYLLSSEI